METTCLKRLEEKKKRDAEQKQKEEQQKLAEAEKRKAKEAAVMEATVVFPTMEVETSDPLINSHLADMMQGGVEDNVADDGKAQCSPAKSKQKRLPSRGWWHPNLQSIPRPRVSPRVSTLTNIPTRELLLRP